MFKKVNSSSSSSNKQQPVNTYRQNQKHTTCSSSARIRLQLVSKVCARAHDEKHRPFKRQKAIQKSARQASSRASDEYPSPKPKTPQLKLQFLMEMETGSSLHSCPFVSRFKKDAAMRTTRDIKCSMHGRLEAR